jgi:hypothetical protein
LCFLNANTFKIRIMKNLLLAFLFLSFYTIVRSQAYKSYEYNVFGAIGNSPLDLQNSNVHFAFNYSYNSQIPQTENVNHNFSQLSPLMYFFGVMIEQDAMYRKYSLGVNNIESSFSFGTGWNYRPNEQWGIRLGGNIAANGGEVSLDRINQNNQHITIDNTTFNPTFLYTHHSKHSSYTESINADYVEVSMEQNNWSFAPEVGLDYHTSEDRWTFRLNAGYNIFFASHTQIEFEQWGKSYNGSMEGGKMFLKNLSDPTIIQSGREAIASPYKLNPWYVNFEIDYRLGA